MKFTFLINQAGIVDAGLADKTDFSDWALLEYIADWQVHGSAYMSNGHVWLDYRHLLAELPMLAVKTKSGVSNRVAKLRDLGLLSSFLTEEGRIFAKVTDFFSQVVRFRGYPRMQAVCADPVHLHERPVHPDERPVHADERILNNKVLNNQEQTKLLARESFSDDCVFDQPLQWVSFFVSECQFPFHIVQTAKTIPMFVGWVKESITVGDMRQAMAACHAWNGNRVPDSPVLYRKFLQSIFDERKRLAEESVFSERPGVGRSREVEDWAKVPKANDDLWPWAKKHGYPGPGSKSYFDYRSFLYGQVEKRSAKTASGGNHERQSG